MIRLVRAMLIVVAVVEALFTLLAILRGEDVSAWVHPLAVGIMAVVISLLSGNIVYLRQENERLKRQLK